MKRFDVKNLDGRVDLQVELYDLRRPPKITKRLNDDQVVELELDPKELVGLAVVLVALVKTREEQAASAPAAGASAPAAPFAFEAQLCRHCHQLVAGAAVELPGGGRAHRSCAAQPIAAALRGGAR